LTRPLSQPNVAATPARQESRSPLFVIVPPVGWHAPDFYELWEYRELLLYLTWRDLKVRYKQTVLGIGWAIIPPLFNMVIFSVIFGGLAKLPSEGVPYVVFSFTGLVPWGLFSRAVSGASDSLLRGAALSAKVYFPRLIVVLSSVLSSLVDASIPFVVLIGLLAWTGIVPGLNAFTLPLFIAFGTLAALGIGIWLAALTVVYRDVAQVSGLVLTAWMYASPVAYSTTLLPAGLLRTVYWVNPVAIVVQGFRWALLGSEFPPPAMVIVSGTLVISLLVTGLYYFRRVEATFVDLV
jgi:homopolymeric O-antigen transport system permease protein